MTIYKTTSEWTGFAGAPGYTNFYFQGSGDGDSAQAVLDKVGTFWTAVDVWIPSPINIRTRPEVEVIDETTGLMERFDAGVEPTPAVGSAAKAHSGTSGACIGWLTGGVRNGRRVRGRTFIVPLNGDAYELDGTLASGALNNFRSAATALAANDGTNLVVWSRPSARGASDGVAHFVTGVRVQDKAAVLRSRRD